MPPRAPSRGRHRSRTAHHADTGMRTVARSRGLARGATISPRRHAGSAARMGRPMLRSGRRHRIERHDVRSFHANPGLRHGPAQSGVEARLIGIGAQMQPIEAKRESLVGDGPHQCRADSATPSVGIDPDSRNPRRVIRSGCQVRCNQLRRAEEMVSRVGRAPGESPRATTLPRPGPSRDPTVSRQASTTLAKYGQRRSRRTRDAPEGRRG